ncbi:class I SAM-dependent DNA methyltransferase [Maribellus sediminis]|uniref:class I SAM-dependent DNA methyltransferase n=1 Tax=Maribellus sediminis TaxID=2696285 RepID=UPI001431409D|nr:class I SAM-dependent methyltransferase [Maribellus sediminis]
MPGKNLQLADDFAADYDASVLQNNWTGPQVLFELLDAELSTPSQLLDLGIGTGESARRFSEAGHAITGIDGSEKMLKQCRNKNIGDRLICHDLEQVPYPLENKFDAIISNGVFHLINPIEPLFNEVKRLLKPNAVFAFTFEEAGNTEKLIEIETGVWEKETESGVLTYKHSLNYIQHLLAENHFTVVQQKQFLAFRNKKSDTDFYFTLIVARLQPNR